LEPFEQYKQDFSWREETRDDNDNKSLSSQDSDFLQNYDDLGRKGEYEEHTLNAKDLKIMVDGHAIPMKKIKVYLLPRSRGCAFFEMCDNIDDALQSLGITCFNNRGKPRLPSLKAAIAPKDTRPLLYISEFEMPEEYRDLASTVGPMILQSLLTDTLKDRWSVAMYIPYNSAQFTQQDKERSYRRRTTPLSEQEKKEKKEWQDRMEALTLQDMRQFFRAGFLQVSESLVLENSPNYFVYTTPDLQGRPILSEHEAKQVAVCKSPPEPPAKTEQEAALFTLMYQKAQARRYMIRSIESFRTKPRREIVEFRHYYGRSDEQRRQIQTLRQKLEQEDSLMRTTEQNINSTRLMIERLQTDEDRNIALEELYTSMNNDGVQLPSRRPHPLTTEVIFGPAIESIERRRADHEKFGEEIRKSESAIDELEVQLDTTLQGMAAKLASDQEENLRALDLETKQTLKKAVPTDTMQLIYKSSAIHACADHMAEPYIQFLLDLLPSENERTIAMNYPNEKGYTPLMVAAASKSLGDSEENKRYEMCSFLMQKGAVRNIQNRRGLTALGVFRESLMSKKDFALTFGFSAFERANGQLANELETLLMPIGGASPADDAAMEDDDEEDDDEEDDDEEDDAEEDDEEDYEDDDEDGDDDDEDDDED